MVVSTGTCAVDVPDIIGMLESAAETAVTNAGCTVGVQTYVWNNDVADCEVTAQSPSACSSCVPPGTAVDMTIARNWSYPGCWDIDSLCYGDTDGNDVINTADFAPFRDGFLKSYPDAVYQSNVCGDWNKDGVINTADFGGFRDTFLQNPPDDCPVGDPCEVYKPGTPADGGGC
jgi:hypothetical protein